MSTQHTGEPTAIGASDRALAAGDVVGEYVIRDQVGQGGFGTVYRAVHPVIGKQVAIKVLARRYSADEAIVRRFVDEARAVNQIRHRNIIDIFSFGQLPDGRHYYVMEYLDGTPLDRQLKERGTLTIEAALPILRSIARALDAAHAKGIAHRDLKPENIVLTFDDEGNTFPKLLDFGIAKLTTPDQERAHRTGTGVPLGTPYYMSPEQCRGRDVDHRTDIYSFGVLTFRLLTGDYPFHGELIEILHKHMHEEPPRASSINPQLTAEIDHAIAWMMQKEPANRPPTTIAAVLALQGDSTSPTPMLSATVAGRATARTGDRGASTADTLAVPTGDPVRTLPEPVKRSRGVLVAAGLVLAGVIGTVTYLAMRSPDNTAPAAAPVAEALRPEPLSRPAPPPPAPAETPQPPAPTHVIVTIVGAPEGTEVKEQDRSLGFVPKVRLERGDATTLLTLHAEGYFPKSIEVIPSADRTIEVKLARRPRPATGTRRPPNPDDIIHDVPGLTE